MTAKQPPGGTAPVSIPDDTRPDFLRPGIRCALEMLLAGGLVLLVGLPADSALFTGAVVALAVVVMVVVLFWALNRQMEAWVSAVIDLQREQRRQQELLERS